MKYPLTIAVFLMMFVFPVVSSFSQSQTEELEKKVVIGKVTSLNWVGSEISVRWYNPRNGFYDEVVISVPHEAKIIKQGRNIWLSDINIGDSVTVEYYDVGFSGLKASRISVKM